MLKFYKIMERCKTHFPSGIGLVMLMFLVVASGGQVMSQELKTVRGIVREDGLPLPGVSVRIKGNSAAGVASDSGGRYSIQTKSTDVLTFSFVGMEPQEV